MKDEVMCIKERAIAKIEACEAGEAALHAKSEERN
jgi:hypothetical protein